MNYRKLIISAASVVTAVSVALIIFAFSVNRSGDSAKSESLPQTTAAQTTRNKPNSAAAAPAATAPATSPAASAAIESTAAATTAAPADSQKSLADFKVISQLPELPTGCEVTSLTMVLNHLGINADKLDIADNYLTKGEYGVTDPRKAFVGNPRTEANSRGCYAPVLVEAANKYLSAKGSDKTAKDISGGDLEKLFPYIDKGIPVIVWGIMDCQKSEVVSIGEADGQTLNWVRPEHCMVLVGYSDTEITEADPYYGAIKTYTREQFKSGYNDLFKQAIAIF